MSNFHILFILVSSLIIIASGEISSHDHNLTKFRVYAHEFVSGPNATVHEVGRAKITGTSPTSFGLLNVGEDLITSGPDKNTGMLGWARAFVVNSGLTESVLKLSADFVFTAGKYNGSSITVVGWKHISNVNQEVPIVGGTGIFRLARGYVVSNTYSFDPTTNYLVLIYDFNVYLH